MHAWYVSVCMHAWYVSVCMHTCMVCECMCFIVCAGEKFKFGHPFGTLHHELPAEGSGKPWLAIVHKYT